MTMGPKSGNRRKKSSWTKMRFLALDCKTWNIYKMAVLACFSPLPSLSPCHVFFALILASALGRPVVIRSEVFPRWSEPHLPLVSCYQLQLIIIIRSVLLKSVAELQSTWDCWVNLVSTAVDYCWKTLLWKVVFAFTGNWEWSVFHVSGATVWNWSLEIAVSCVWVCSLPNLTP